MSLFTWLFGKKERPPLSPKPLSVSEELQYLYEGDQGERSDKFKVSNPMKNDELRLKRVIKILQEYGVFSRKSFPNLKDYYHAAMIMLHGSLLEKVKNPAFCWAASKLVKFAMEKGLKDFATKRLYAESIDRALMLEGKPQKYGTQFKDGEQLWPVDPFVSDEERALYGIQPLKFLEIGREIKYFQADILEFFENVKKDLLLKMQKPEFVKTKSVEVLEKIKTFNEKFAVFPQEIKKQEIMYFIHGFLSNLEAIIGEQLHNRNNISLLKDVLFPKEKKLYEDVSNQLKSLM